MSTSPARSSKTSSDNIAHPALPLVDAQRARKMLADVNIDLLCAKEDENLFYLSGHASDSSLCHFYDEWACALFPASASVPGALIVPDYDLAYQTTRPTCLPELRTYGSEWSSAGTLLKEINAGVGIETELRQPLRELFARTRADHASTLVNAIKKYIDGHFGTKPITIAFDDLRFAPVIESAFNGQVKTIDARAVLRKIRAVKTETEIGLLRTAAAINDKALKEAANAIKAGAPWNDMVLGYRRVLAMEGAKPLGERGMLFNSGPDGAFVLDHEYVASKTFEVGDTVVLDAICQYRLYHADMARTAVIGEPTRKQMLMYKAVMDALGTMESQLKPGVHTADMSRIAADVMRKHGFNPQQTTLVFHPIGLEIFDYAEPEHATHGWVVEANSVMNFEVFYRDTEQGGMHLEDSMLVRDSGVESFSHFSRDLIVIN